MMGTVGWVCINEGVDFRSERDGRRETAKKSVERWEYDCRSGQGRMIWNPSSMPGECTKMVEAECSSVHYERSNERRFVRALYSAVLQCASRFLCVHIFLLTRRSWLSFNSV